MELQRVICGGKATMSVSLLLMLLHLTTTLGLPGDVSGISHVIFKIADASSVPSGRPALGSQLNQCMRRGFTLPGANCPRTCVPLRQCPQLSNLLSSPTTENINTLVAATCRVVNRVPLVCCPQSLLPRDCGEPYNGGRIYGGFEVTLGTAPWMAALGYINPGTSEIEFMCGGSIINERYILTAAHCVYPRYTGGRRIEVVRLGEWDLSTDPDCTEFKNGTDYTQYCAPPVQNFNVEQIVAHPQYNTRTDHSDDIALIRVSRNIDFSLHWIHPVCIPPPNFNVRGIPGLPEPVVTGWGYTEKGTTSQRMLRVSVPFISNQQCNSTYNGRIVHEQICLGGRSGQDSCNSDSGGPLIVAGPQGPPFLLIGVVSYGPIFCGQANYSGIYTSVSHYRNWIDQNMRPW